MNKKRKIYIIIGLVVLSGIILSYFFGAEISNKFSHYYNILADKDKVADFILSFDIYAPFIFVLLQIAQVIFAPIPGEASGFIGGYLFGIFLGFVYSTIGLSIGSIINFAIGNFFGQKYTIRLVPKKYIEKFENILKKEGIIIIFICFIFPGFPKDYLCLFLGLSGMLRFEIFLFTAIIGRMPGTLLLSMQGAYFSQKLYWHFFGVFILCIFIIFLSYRFRERIYEFIDYKK